MWSRRSRDGSIPIPTPCARDASGRASLRHDQGPHWRDPLPNEALGNLAAEMALHVLAYNLTR